MTDLLQHSTWFDLLRLWLWSLTTILKSTLFDFSFFFLIFFVSKLLGLIAFSINFSTLPFGTRYHFAQIIPLVASMPQKFLCDQSQTQVPFFLYLHPDCAVSCWSTQLLLGWTFTQSTSTLGSLKWREGWSCKWHLGLYNFFCWDHLLLPNWIRLVCLTSFGFVNNFWHAFLIMLYVA